MSYHCLGCNVEFPPDGGSGVYGFCLQCREALPLRVRLTESEWQAELARAKGVQAKDVDRLVTPPGVRELSRDDWEAARRHWEAQMGYDPDPLITRTPRKRSRWGRPWERKR